MKSTCVNVCLAERSYPINIGTDFSPLELLPGSGKQALLVSDSLVEPLYAPTCRKSLEKSGFKVAVATVPAGEKSKTLGQAEILCKQAAAYGLDRSAVIVALGGGVVGDLAGFVAATFLRGIIYIQAPTTLLAMVDSSVGGKTGVNLDAGKNLVGCFHQPAGVVINLETLHSLPEREYSSGLAEIIKYGLILDADFYNRLAAQTERLLARDTGFLSEIIARCCTLKAEVVTRDERENGPRALLNFGHTFGHAVEAWAGYGRLTHGEAVAVGMVFAAHLSQRHGYLEAGTVTALEQTLSALGLPVRVRAQASAWPELWRRMQNDKKTRGGIVRFVLLENIGRAVHGREAKENDLREVWNGIRN